MATKIAPRIYEITVAGRTFEVDGQNHEFDSKEWQVFERKDSGDMDWVETYPTKRDAIEDIKEFAQQSDER